MVIVPLLNAKGQVEIKPNGIAIQIKDNREVFCVLDLVAFRNAIWYEWGFSNRKFWLNYSEPGKVRLYLRRSFGGDDLVVVDRDELLSALQEFVGEIQTMDDLLADVAINI